MLFKILAMSSINNNHDKWNPTSLTLDDAKIALRNIGNDIKSFATGVVDKIGGGIRSIKEKGWSEIKADTLTKLSSIKNSMVESFGKTVRSVVKRFNPDAGARMSMNHYADKLKNDLYLPGFDNNDTNLNVSHTLDNLCNNKDLTTQEKADILKTINKQLSSSSSKKEFSSALQNKIEILVLDKKRIKSTTPSTNPTENNSIENTSQESSADLSTLTETQQNAINNFTENPNKQSSVAQSAKKAPPPLPPRKQNHTQIPIENTSSAVQQPVTSSPNKSHRPLPPIPQKKKPPQLPPKPNAINQQPIQEDAKPVMQSPEQPHVALTKQPPKPPTKTLPQPPHPKTDPQPTIAQSTNQVPTKTLPQPHQKATLQTSTQSAVEENKTAETTSTSHSDTKKTTTSFFEKIKSKFSSGGNKPTKTNKTSQDSEPMPITQDTQNELDNLLKKLDSLQESEKVTELANNLIRAKNLGFEATAKTMIDHVQKELEKIPTEETPKINNGKTSTKNHQRLTEMLKNELKNITETTENDQDNELDDLEDEIPKLINPEDYTKEVSIPETPSEIEDREPILVNPDDYINGNV